MGTVAELIDRELPPVVPPAARSRAPALPSSATSPKLLRGCLLTLLEGSPGLVTVANTAGGLLYMNSVGRAMLGIGKTANVVGRKIADFYAPTAYERLCDEAIPTSLRTGVWYGETMLLDRRGTETPVAQLIMATRITRDVDVTVLSSIAWDIREQKQIEKELRHQATHDDLTGLPNRNLLMDRLTQALLSAERHRHIVGVLFLDIDSFKGVNDTHGHEAGNRLLHEFGSRLRSRLRAEDTIARYGGDEFVIIVPELVARNDVAYLRREISSVLDEPFFIGTERVRLTASIGAATYPHDGKSADALLRVADTAMYERKRRGKDVAGCEDAAMALRRVAAFSEV